MAPWMLSKRERTASSAAAEEPPGRRARKGTGKGGAKSKKKKGGDLMSIICKMLLASALAIRDIQGILYTVVLIPAKSVIAVAMNQAAKTYSDEVKERGKGHGLGPPVIHEFAAMLEALVAADKTGEADKVLIKASLDDNKELPPREVVMRWPHCRLIKCCASETFRLEFCVGEGCLSLCKAIRRALLVQPDVEERIGRGPPTGFEQALEKAWEVGEEDGLSDD